MPQAKITEYDIASGVIPAGVYNLSNKLQVIELDLPNLDFTSGFGDWTVTKEGGTGPIQQGGLISGAPAGWRTVDGESSWIQTAKTFVGGLSATLSSAASNSLIIQLNYCIFATTTGNADVTVTLQDGSISNSRTDNIAYSSNCRFKALSLVLGGLDSSNSVDGLSITVKVDPLATTSAAGIACMKVKLLF